MEKYLLALDGGTGSFRSILFDTMGNQKYTEQIEWEHKTDPEIPGSMTFDTENNWLLICECIKSLLHKNSINPESIAAVATTTMREGFVIYDDSNSELLAFANVDSRAEKESHYLKSTYPELEKNLYKTTGESFALGALPRLLWVKNHRPEIITKATKINMLNDWITFKLTDIIAVEPSNVGTTGLFNIIDNEWELSSLTEFDIYLEPSTVIQSGQIVGPISPNASNATGLSQKTLVVMGGGDAQLGCVGVGSVKDNQATLVGGSFWQLEFNSFNHYLDPEYQVRVNRHAIPNLYQYEMISWMPGIASKWFLDSFFDIEKEFNNDKNLAYQQIEEYTSQVPLGSNGVLTTFSNAMNITNLNNCSPTFTNFEFDAHLYNRYTFYRSFMESIAYSVLEHKTKIENLTHQKINEIIFAGGASNNSLWCQIIADVLNCTVKVPIIKEATAFGAAMLAGVGAHIFNDIIEVSKAIKYEKTYQPNLNNHKKYIRLAEKWRVVYDAQLTLSNSNITKSLWKAPGI